MRYELELMLRLLAAAVFTGLVGWERETARKSAGLKRSTRLVRILKSGES